MSRHLLSLPPSPSNVEGYPGIYEFNPAKGDRYRKVGIPGSRFAVCYTGCVPAQPRNKNRLAGLANGARIVSLRDH